MTLRAKQNTILAGRSGPILHNAKIAADVAVAYAKL